METPDSNITNKICKPEMSRQEALKRMGLIALSGTTMMLLLNQPAKGMDSQNSPDLPPEWAKTKQISNVATTVKKA